MNFQQQPMAFSVAVQVPNQDGTSSKYDQWIVQSDTSPDTSNQISKAQMEGSLDILQNLEKEGKI